MFAAARAAAKRLASSKRGQILSRMKSVTEPAFGDDARLSLIDTLLEGDSTIFLANLVQGTCKHGAGMALSPQ